MTTQTKKATITLTLALTGAEVKRLRSLLASQRAAYVDQGQRYDLEDVTRGPIAEIDALLDKIPASREE